MCEKRLIPEEELRQYQAIGTVNECQEAREKQTAKRPVDRRELINFNLRVYVYRGGIAHHVGKRDSYPQMGDTALDVARL